MKPKDKCIIHIIGYVACILIMLKVNVSGKRYLTTNAIPTCYLDIYDNVNKPSIIEEGTNMNVNADYNRQSSSFLYIDESCTPDSQPLDLCCTSRSSLNLNASKLSIGIQY